MFSGAAQHPLLQQSQVRKDRTLLFGYCWRRCEINIAVVIERDVDPREQQTRIVGIGSRCDLPLAAMARAEFLVPERTQFRDPHAQCGTQVVTRVVASDHESIGWRYGVEVRRCRRARRAQQIEERLGRPFRLTVDDLHRVDGPAHEFANRALLAMRWRFVAQLEPERIGDARRFHRLFFRPAGLARNRPRIRFARVGAEHDIERKRFRRRCRAEADERPAMLLQPIVERRALRRRDAHQRAVRQNRRPARHLDLRLAAGIDRHRDLEPVDGAVTDRVARQPAVAARQPRKFLIEIVGAKDHPERVLDMLGGIRRCRHRGRG